MFAALHNVANFAKSGLRDFRAEPASVSTLRTSWTDADETAKSWPLMRNRMICSVRTGCGFDGSGESHYFTPTGRCSHWHDFAEADDALFDGGVDVVDAENLLDVGGFDGFGGHAEDDARWLRPAR